MKIALTQYQGGLVDFNRIALVELNLVQQQDLLAQAQGNIALGLIDLFRALGGGWEYRLQETAGSVDPAGGILDAPPVNIPATPAKKKALTLELEPTPAPPTPFDDRR